VAAPKASLFNVRTPNVTSVTEARLARDPEDSRGGRNDNPPRAVRPAGVVPWPREHPGPSSYLLGGKRRASPSRWRRWGMRRRRSRTRYSRPADSGGRRPRGRSSCSGTHRRRCRRRCRGRHQQQEGTWNHPFTRTKRFGHSADSNLAVRMPQSALICVTRSRLVFAARPPLPTAPCRRPPEATRSRTGRCGR
jgi:hypothetical protein